MRHLLLLLMLVITTSCSTIDKSKIERQLLIEGKFDCETSEYYLAHSENVPNKESLTPNATVTLEQYACARLGKVPKGKEIKSFEYFKRLRDDNRETMIVLFVPCDYMKDRTHMCNH